MGFCEVRSLILKFDHFQKSTCDLKRLCVPKGKEKGCAPKKLVVWKGGLATKKVVYLRDLWFSKGG